MAVEGLFLLKDDGRNTTDKSELRYPKLGVMLDYILRQQPKLLDTTETREQRLLFPPKTYVVMIQFLLKCFQSELEQNKSTDESTAFRSAVEKMCLLLEHAMAFEGSVELHANASKALITIGSCLPEVNILDAYSLVISKLLCFIFLSFFFHVSDILSLLDDCISLCTKSFMDKATT